MNRRSRALAEVCAVALACGVAVVVVWRHRAITPAEVKAPHAREVAKIPFLGEARVVPPARKTEVAAALAPPAAPVAGPPNSMSDEAALMRGLRSAQRSDPALAIRLAREGNRRFPRSSDAPERAAILVHALAEQGRSSEARAEAEEMVNRYPDSAWVREVEQFTGARRHRNVRVGPNGELRYVDPTPPT
ncbi:MAG TPA: hypothetical protein VG963_14335 [Polyangiaceae bacterium]|nr:hypothetical protein [Polyangiaceae bacterium]